MNSRKLYLFINLVIAFSEFSDFDDISFIKKNVSFIVHFFSSSRLYKNRWENLNVNNSDNFDMSRYLFR